MQSIENFRGYRIFRYLKKEKTGFITVWVAKDCATGETLYAKSKLDLMRKCRRKVRARKGCMREAANG